MGDTMNRTTATLALACALIAAFMEVQRTGHLPQSTPQIVGLLSNMLGGAIMGLFIAWIYRRSQKPR